METSVLRTASLGAATPDTTQVIRDDPVISTASLNLVLADEALYDINICGEVKYRMKVTDPAEP